MASSVPKLALSRSRDIPFDKLVLSPTAATSSLEAHRTAWFKLPHGPRGEVEILACGIERLGFRVEHAGHRFGAAVHIGVVDRQRTLFLGDVEAFGRECPARLAAPRPAAVRADICRALGVRGGLAVTARLKPVGIAINRRAAAKFAWAAGVDGIFLALEDAGNFGLDRLDRGVEVVAGVVDGVAVANQQGSIGGKFVRTIGIVRAGVKIGMQNLAYNMRRLVVLERIAMAAG